MAHFAPNSAPILVPPSPSDGPGGFYTYFDAPLSIAKYGRSRHPARRKREWGRQCQGEVQIWLAFYWEVPFAAKFERLIHLHYQRAGYWLGPVTCMFCGVNHQEKYHFDAGFVHTVELYLGILGWPIVSQRGEGERWLGCELREVSRPIPPLSLSLDYVQIKDDLQFKILRRELLRGKTMVKSCQGQFYFRRTRNSLQIKQGSPHAFL
ncbi:hypothetical protein B0H11DRAFT_1932749 [Mycena galericulata]|nr:hypothetical protein B0H11DRAFT_1932749 [Mycena galericulata]